MPVVPYTDPNIKPVITWPEMVNEQIDRLINDISELRQQVRDLQAAQQALIVAMLKTDGDEDDADF